MATPSTSLSADDPALAYAIRQLRWYRRARGRARFFHQAGEMTILLTTSATVVAAALHAFAIVTATIAAVTLFLTGFRQVFGPTDNWLRASRAWVAIEHAILRYQLLPEEQRDADAQQDLLEQVIAINLHTNNEWASEQRKRAAGQSPHQPGGAPGER